MFTVKILKPNGHEDLYEARETTKEPGGLLMQTENETIFIGPHGNMMAWDSISDHRKRFLERGVESLDESATIYVMNRFGSTVATYNL